MTMSKKMQESINEQFNVELSSAYFYLAVSSHFLGQNFDGFAHWMKVQAEEELVHAMKCYDYLNERQAEVVFKAVPAPHGSWPTHISAFEDALKQEQKNTKLINNLMDLAIAEKDHASNAFLQWFVTEQVEEESIVTNVLQKLKMVGNDANGLLMMDQKLGARAGDAS